jgi:hypothetical protein
MTAQQILAVVRLVVIVAAIVVIYRNNCAPNNLFYAAPYLLWLGHALLYLVAFLILSLSGQVNAVFVNIWSASLQLQGFLTVLIVEIFRYYRHRQKSRGLSGC